jgi:hypothetical protein
MTTGSMDMRERASINVSLASVKQDLPLYY